MSPFMNQGLPPLTGNPLSDNFLCVAAIMKSDFFLPFPSKLLTRVRTNGMLREIARVLLYRELNYPSIYWILV